MAGKWYVGRTPDSDSVEVPKAFADQEIANTIPTGTFVRNKINQAITANSLVTPAYVNLSNSRLAQKVAVDNADRNYVPTSWLGVPNGVAALDSSGQIPSSELPTGIPTEWTAQAYDVATSGQILISSAQTVLTNNIRELQIASIEVPDPGYPWRALPFAIVQGGDPGSGNVPNSRLEGTSTFGMLAVLPPQGISNQVYSAGICTDTYYMNFYQCLPYAGANQTPLTVPPIIGGLELDLCGSCWSGSGYQFGPAGLMYWILVMPSM